MLEFEMQLLHQSESPELNFLPEGPYPRENGLSWIAIQHSATATTGSLCIYDFASRQVARHALLGRPGFAFPTQNPDRYVLGMERCLVTYDLATQQYRRLTEELEPGVSGTVINDGVAFSGGVIFGCKDLKFAERKAGLYVWRKADGSTIRLRNDQTCSNGKVILTEEAGGVTFLDIDTPTKTVVRYTLDVAAGKLSEPELALDLRSLDIFPDGMIATPDGTGVIISFYNPGDATCGETRQYSLRTGLVEAVWKTPHSPQVTCPQLVTVAGKIMLVVTTAAENMSAERLAKYPRAGAIFIGPTSFTSLPNTPCVEV